MFVNKETLNKALAFFEKYEGLKIAVLSEKLRNSIMFMEFKGVSIVSAKDKPEVCFSGYESNIVGINECSKDLTETALENILSGNGTIKAIKTEKSCKRLATEFFLSGNTSTSEYFNELVLNQNNAL